MIPTSLRNVEIPEGVRGAPTHNSSCNYRSQEILKDTELMKVFFDINGCNVQK